MQKREIDKHVNESLIQLQRAKHTSMFIAPYVEARLGKEGIEDQKLDFKRSYSTV